MGTVCKYLILNEIPRRVLLCGSKRSPLQSSSHSKTLYKDFEMNQNLSEFNIKYRITLRLGETRKLSKIIMMN